MLCSCCADDTDMYCVNSELHRTQSAAIVSTGDGRSRGRSLYRGQRCKKHGCKSGGLNLIGKQSDLWQRKAKLDVEELEGGGFHNQDSTDSLESSGVKSLVRCNESGVRRLQATSHGQLNPIPSIDSAPKGLSPHLCSCWLVRLGTPMARVSLPTDNLTSKSWCTTTTPSRVTWTSNSTKSLWLVAALRKDRMVFSRTERPSCLLAPEPRCLCAVGWN